MRIPAKVLWGLLLVLIAITAFELFYYLFLSSQSTALPTTSSSQSRLLSTETVNTPTSSPSASFKILYQAKEDKVGRSIVYESENKNIYNGLGPKTSLSGRPYMVGIFAGWEKIPGSADRLMKLTDPAKKISFNPIRVVFEPSSLFPGRTKTTRLSVENINIAMSSDYNSPSEDLSFLVEIQDLSEKKLQTFLQTGDAVVVFPLATWKGETKWEVVKDEENLVLVQQIMLRRFAGAKSEDLKTN